MRPPTGTIQSPANGIAAKKSWPHHLIITLTLVTAVATLCDPLATTSNLDALLLLLATAGSISALARTLPLQSVLFAAFITALIGGAAHGLSARTGLPFGPLSFSPTSGPQLFNVVPLTVPLLWVIVIFNSRGVARLALRPWRKVKNYGFLLMGLATGLTLIFDIALEPFAHAKHLWLWQPTKIPVTWYGASPLSFCGWTFVSLIILAIIMPYLIRKQPGNPSAPDFTPLALWLGAIGLFAINAARTGQWNAVVLDAAIAGTVLFFSWRGAKW
jgi:uncharacterized membrane protein